MEVLLIKSRNCHMKWKHTTKTLPLQSLVSEPPHYLPALLSSILPHSLSYGVTVLSYQSMEESDPSQYVRKKQNTNSDWVFINQGALLPEAFHLFFFLIVQQFFILTNFENRLEFRSLSIFSGILSEYVWIYYCMSEPVLSFLKFI